ncbi:MAG: extracellular solute-binding protein [Clostridia bacterium]|nr:extracellular solute-binding protein [Clostridia bacterium]
MKRVLCAILAVAMLLALTACDTGSGSQSNPVDDPEYFNARTAVGDYSDGITLPNLDDAKVSVMMSIDWNYLETNNDPDDPFAQYQATLIWRDVYSDMEGDVTVVTISDEQQTDYLATQTASGTAPDIIPCNYDLTYPKWNAAGLTASIDQYAAYLQLDAKDPTDPEKDLYSHEMMSQFFQWGGESHGAITLSQPNRDYIVYNKTKFEQAGQKNPLELWQEGQWTWTQFVKTAKAMTNDKDFGFTGWGLFPYFAPYSMLKLDEENHVSLEIDDPKYMRFMTEVYNLYQTVGAARNTNDDLQLWSTLFPAGTDAMIITSMSGYKRVSDAARKQEGDTFGIAPLPVFDPNGETTPITPVSLWAYSLSSAAKNPIGACAYIRLETLVSRNITKALKGTTWSDTNLTDEEKEMLEAVEEYPMVVELARGVGDCYSTIDTYIVPPIYYGQTDSSVQAVFDAQKPTLQAAVDEFNEMVDETAAEIEAEREKAAEKAAAAE